MLHADAYIGFLRRVCSDVVFSGDKAEYLLVQLTENWKRRRRHVTAAHPLARTAVSRLINDIPADRHDLTLPTLGSRCVELSVFVPGSMQAIEMQCQRFEANLDWT